MNENMARNKHNIPGIIKYPFWKMTYQNPKATYVCINYGDASAPGEIAGHIPFFPGGCAAFGDGGNDVEMLAYCRYSYAMANASHRANKCISCETIYAVTVEWSFPFIIPLAGRILSRLRN